MKRLQFAVIGLGLFGRSVATQLASYGYDVLAIDLNMKPVEDIADVVTKAVQADTSDMDVLKTLGLEDFDEVIVSIGTDLTAAMLTVLNLKEIGVKHVIAKARSDQAMKILEKVGADRIVRPEYDMGVKVAKSLTPTQFISQLDLDDEYSIAEIHAPTAWVGRSLRVLNVRKIYKMNVLGIRKEGTGPMNMEADPDYEIQANDQFLVLGKANDLENYVYF